MATETHIPESVYLKIGEKEDNALSSEILEEKVTELLGNKVKQVESSSQVAETVNTQVEASIPTNESGTFFQAVSESFDAATRKDQDPELIKTSESVEDHTEEIRPSVQIEEKTENQGLNDRITTNVCVLTQTEAKGENEEKNDEKAIEKEACEEKDESAAGLKYRDSMAPSKQEGDRDGVTSTQDETCKDIKETTTVAGIKEQDFYERPREFVKQETEDKSIDTQEAIEQWESVKKIEQEEETEEIRPCVEIEEKKDAITADACISTQTKYQVEITEHEEKDEEEVTQSDDGQKENSDILSIKDVWEENSSEKVEYESYGMKLNEKAIAILNKDEEREQEVTVLEKDQGEDVVASAQDVSFEGNEREVVMGKESIEEDTEEIRSSVETTGVCISTQTKPEEETTKNNEKNDEENIESDDDLMKKSGSHMVKEVCEDTDSEKTECEEGLKPSNNSSILLNENEISNKDEDQEKEQELYVSEKDQTESQVKTTKLEEGNEDVTESDDGQKDNPDSLTIKEVCEQTNSEKVESERVELFDSSSIKINDKEIALLSNDEVEDKEQDQGEDDVKLRDGINTDVCVSTQAELVKETIENEDKNDEKAIEKKVCEDISPEKAESEVGLPLSDSMVPSKKDLNTLEKDQGNSDGVTSSQDTTCEDTKETTPGQYAATVADFKDRDLNEEAGDFVKEETEDKSVDAQQASEECENGVNFNIEQKPEESVKHEDQENEQEVNILEKDQGMDDFTSTQDVSFEGDLQEKNHKSEDIELEIVTERKGIEEDTQEIKSSAVTPEKTEQHRLINAIPTNVCISTQTEPEETTETQEKNDEEATESDDGQTKSGIPMVEEICEETVLEKDESKEGLKLSNSTSLALNENEIVSKDENQEKVQELNVSEKDQSSGDDVTSSQNASNEDIKETTIGHVTTVVDLEEEAEDKAIDAQEASVQYEDRANDNREQNPEDSVNDIVHSCSKIEHEEYTEEIKPSVETNEEKDVCISTQTESQEEAIKNEEKADNPFVKEVCEETDLKKTESEEEIKLSDNSKMNLNEKTMEIISKDEDQENEHEPKTAVFEDELHGKNNDGECNELEIFQNRESIKGDNEDIRASVETEEIMEQQGSLHAITSDVSILAQRESQEETTKNEEKNEEPIESDDGWKEKPAIPSDKEDCEETSLEKVKPEEEIELHGSPNTKINDKTITSKDEDQEVNMSGEGQDKDDVTNSQVAAFIVEEEDLQEKNYHNEGDVKTREVVDEDSKEIKSSNETKENSEQQGLSHIITTDACSLTQTEPIEETTENEENNDEEAIENDDDRTKKPESSLVKEICEATISEKDNSEEGVEHYDSSSTILIENETESKEEKLEKEQELKISEVQGGEDDVISSQNASIQDIKEIKTGKHATSVASFEEGKAVSAITEEIIMEEAEDKSIDAQEASKQCENGANDNREPMTEESVNKPVNSCLESVDGNINEEEAYAVNTETEAKLDAENQANITEDRSEIKDEMVSTEKMSSELGQPKEQNIEEIEACLTKTINEKTEDEITQKKDLSHDSTEDTNDITTKEEKYTLEHEPTEEQNDGFGEVLKEKLTDFHETTAVEPQEDITLSGTLGTSTEDTSNSEKAKADSEVLPIEDLESVSEIQIPEVVPKSEDLNVKEEYLMHVDKEKGIVTEENSGDEKAEPTTEIKQETFEEVCEETSSEKAELEGLKLSDSSDIKINEKVMTALYDDDQEKGQEVNISTEDQSKDNVTSSNDTAFEEENLQEKSYQNEINEREFDKTRESLDEDTKEIKTSVETKEHKSEIPLFKEVCEAKSSEMAESEDGVKHSEIFNTKLEGNEIVSKEENLEKEQELTVSEVQGGGDDLTGSDNVSNEDIKETNIGQRATTVVNFEEGEDLSAMTKDILVEEAEDKSNDAQQASEQSENEAKNKSEQNPKDIVNEPVKPCAEIVEGKLTEDDTYTGNDKEIEAKLDAENQVERTEDRSEMKDEVVSTEKITSELGQPKEQNTEETEACLTKTTTEKTENEITKGEKDSSHESTEHTNDNITKEEICTLEPVEDKNGGMDEVSTENLTNLYETTVVEPQEDITPFNSLGTSTEDVSNSEKAKAESENLPIEDLESVSEVQIPEVIPKSEDVKVKEECLMSEAATKEILSDENPEPYGERKLTYESTTDDHINETTQQAERSCIPTEENVTRVEEIGESDSLYVKRDMEEVSTQKNQLTSKEGSSEMVKDVIFTEEVPSDMHKEHEINDFKEQTVEEDSYSKIQNEMAHEISYSDPIPVRNPEVTEVRVDAQIGQEYLQAAEDISYESKVKNDSVDEAPKEEIIPSLEEVKTIEPEVDLSNIESTAYPSESKELPIPDLESVSDVQAREISADSEVRKVKEECIALATAQHMDENKVEEEQKNNTNEILSVPDTEEENVKQVPAKSDKEKSDFNTEEKDLTIENIKLHGELEPTSESVIEEDQVNKIKPQPEQSDITSENIKNDQESKLEHKSEKDLEDDLKFAPENQIKNIENQDEIMKNIILTDEVSEKDKRPTEIDKTSTSNQKELTNEIELSNLIPVGNTEVTESQLKQVNIQAAEDEAKDDSVDEESSTITGEVKDDSVDEASKNEIIPVLEYGKALEVQVNLPETESTDTPSNEQESTKLREDSTKLREGMPCSTQEIVEEKGVVVSQLTDREILEVPNVEFEKKERDGELISDIQTPEEILKTEVKEEHSEATNNTCETFMGEESSEKILESMVPPEELTSPTVEDQTNELVPETDKTSVEHSSTDRNPKFTEEEFTETFSEDQTSVKERYIEEEGQDNVGVENKEAKSGNEVVEDVIVSEVLLEDETTTESKSIKDNINEEAIHNQLTSATNEVCEIERLSSSPNELLETKDSVEDTEDPKLIAENPKLKDETFTVMNGSNEDSLVAPGFESLENMVTEEKIIKPDTNEEKETLEEPQANDPAQTTSDSISSSREQDIEVRSGDNRGHGDMIKLEEIC